MRHRFTIISVNNNSVGWPETLTCRPLDMGTDETVDILIETLPAEIREKAEENEGLDLEGAIISMSYAKPVVVEAVGARIDP